MFSIVVPTLNYSPQTLQIIAEIFKADERVSEILVINNSGLAIQFPALNLKIRQVVLPRNIYVNPSWNLAANLADESSEWLMLLNDDVIVPGNILDLLTPQRLQDYTLIGVRGDTIHHLSDHSGFSQEALSIHEVENHRTWGFGVCMLAKRSGYPTIPNELKIWCGDDFLFQEYKAAGGKIGLMDLTIRTVMSTSSEREEFRAIRTRDVEIFNRVYKRGFLICG